MFDAACLIYSMCPVSIDREVNEMTMVNFNIERPKLPYTFIEMLPWLLTPEHWRAEGVTTSEMFPCYYKSTPYLSYINQRESIRTLSFSCFKDRMIKLLWNLPIVQFRGARQSWRKAFTGSRHAMSTCGSKNSYKPERLKQCWQWT